MWEPFPKDRSAIENFLRMLDVLPYLILDGIRTSFITRVMQRSDANAEHWKDKFIDDLPPLFARKRLRKNLKISMMAILFHITHTLMTR